MSFANAQTDSRTIPEISYPVAELGNCADKTSCKDYCDKTENIDACLSFAEKNNLMQKEEIDTARKFKNNGMTGPGGCKGKDKCDAYCSDSVHIDECITFAEKNGLMSGEELSEAKKVQAAIAKGIKPPACGGKKSCETYCSSSEHMEECMNFSIEAGIMDPQKQEESKKVLSAIKRGIKPPACKGKDACDAYCGTHMEECMTFSLAADMVPDDQKEQMEKTLDAFKQGIKPPACQPNPPSESGQSDQPRQPSGQGLQSCDQYCADSSHVEECVKFSVAIGNMTKEQGQNSIKNGNKGPGGCKGKEACNTFCDNPDNQETCFNFAKDNGMIPKEGLRNRQDDQPRKNQQNKQDQSEDKFKPGPGTENPGGQQMPQQAGPGGCKGPEECQKYCDSNPEVCKNFQPQQRQTNQQNQNQSGPRLPQQQPGQPNQGDTSGSDDCGTGPGTCSGIGPDDMKQQNPPSPSPSSFLQGVKQNLLANIF